MKQLTTCIALLILIATGCFAEEKSVRQKSVITINANAPRRTVNSEMYGIFFEEINHAGDGGLYAEMVQNRDMEATTLPEGWKIEGSEAVTPKGWRTRLWYDSELPAWSFLANGDVSGSMELDNVQPLNERNPHSLKLTVTKTGKPENGDLCGIANSGYRGMNVEKGKWYDVSFYARAAEERSVGLVFSLETPGGKVCARGTIPEIGRGGWKLYKLGLKAYNSDAKCRLVISPIEPVTMWLDVVSVFPRETFKNRPNGMRVDVGRALADMKPGFLRFPGGCIVEGASLSNRFRWKDSIGDISQRRGSFNLWGYYSTYGLGFHEYLQLAEDLGAEVMYVCNAGMSCQMRNGELCAEEDIQLYVQDALDAIEYATGPATSEWGAKRAENGHPEPFTMKYVEIGNENSGADYAVRYKIFYDAIKAKYPDIITIANTAKDMNGAEMEIVDEHHYPNPAGFFNMAHFYDNRSRDGAKVYVGEYAVQHIASAGTLIGALSEAVFMLNMEKNADLVTMCSHVPLFENISQRNWPANLNHLYNSRVAVHASYQIEKLFGIHRPDVVLDTSVETGKTELKNLPVEVDSLYAQAGIDEKNGELILKVVNPTPGQVESRVVLKGLEAIGSSVRVISIGSADANAENSLDSAAAVIPAETRMTVEGAEFTASFAPQSLTILRLPAECR